MNRALAILAFSVLSGSLSAQESPTTPKAAQVRIIQGPKIELAKEHLTIINWFGRIRPLKRVNANPSLHRL
jgi:hypothetical protein